MFFISASERDPKKLKKKQVENTKEIGNDKWRKKDLEKINDKKRSEKFVLYFSIGERPKKAEEKTSWRYKENWKR